jgi:hypothetical protein
VDDLVRRVPPPSGGAGPSRGLDAVFSRARGQAAFRSRLRVAAAAAACLLALGLGYLLGVRSAPGPATLAERVARLLAEYAETGTDARRDAIARELSAEGDDALPYLVHALDSPSLSHQVAATRILGRFRDRRVAELLVAYAENRGMLAPPAPRVNDVLAEPISAETALALLDAEGVPREAVLEALRTVYNPLRLESRQVALLRKLGYTRAGTLPPDAQVVVDALRERLRSRELSRRLAAIDAVRELQIQPLVPELIRCLGTEGAREPAHAALREITRQDLPIDANVWEQWREKAASMEAKAAK